MRTATVSARLPREEAEKLDDLAREMGVERSALLKQIIRRGCSDILFDRACEAYRRGDVTLSRAAEIAAVSVWDMVASLQKRGIELNYSAEDLAADLHYVDRR